MRTRRIPAGLPWVMPAVIVLLALSIYPMVYSVKVSLTDSTGALTLANFTRLLQDRVFGAAAIQTIVLTIVALAIEFVLGMALAAREQAREDGASVAAQGRLYLLPSSRLPDRSGWPATAFARGFGSPQREPQTDD